MYLCGCVSEATLYETDMPLTTATYARECMLLYEVSCLGYLIRGAYAPTTTQNRKKVNLCVYVSCNTPCKSQDTNTTKAVVLGQTCMPQMIGRLDDTNEKTGKEQRASLCVLASALDRSSAGGCE